MLIAYLKSVVVQSVFGSHILFKHHEHKVMDKSLLLLSPEEITAKAHAEFDKADIGHNIYTQGFKTLHLKTQKKMHYSLETIL